jgi:hypothetical protein
MLAKLICGLKIENYPLLYLNEKAILACCLRSFLSVEDLQEINQEIEVASLDERGHFIEEAVSELVKVGDVLASLGDPLAQEQARKVFAAMNEEEQQYSIRQAQYLFGGFLATFYQNLSLMVHGEKMTALVGQALAGNDDALVKAVQIDVRCLTEIPHFKTRLIQAREQGDQDFCDLVSYRVKRPPYQGKIRYKSLWFTFAILESCSLLTLPHKEILDICDQAGVGGYKNRIEDVKYLPKQIKRYRAFQRRGVESTP